MYFTRLILLLGICAMPIQMLFAQQGIRGYYIDSQGERHEATFKLRFDEENYEQFEVISDGGSLTLTPQTVSEVRLENGRLFQSETLPDHTVKAFVLVVRDGEIDLLKWQRQYFVRKGQELVALKELTSTKEVDGKETKVVTKQYQGVLLSLLKPSPDQAELSKAIRTAGLNDRDLIKVIDSYHRVNGLALDTQLITAQGPAFVTRVKVQGGVGFQSMIKNFENQGFTYGLESGVAPYVEAGVRFTDFRNAPRLFVDLGLGYYAESDVVEAEGSQISFDLTGKQTFKASSVVIPLQIYYILAKGNSSALYAGTGLSFWISSYDNESAEVILDNGQPELITHRDDFVIRKPASVSPNLKLGWSKDLAGKSQLFVEAKADVLLKNYEMIPFTYYAIYNLGVLTLSAGITF
jgi:hypothetical protein